MARERGDPVRATESVLLACLVCFSGSVLAQATHKEPAATLEFGGTGSWDVKGGSSFGPAVAVEVTPIENWLELEAGVTPLFGNGAREWDTDLLFKKPWTFSKKVEFMAGVGPEWVHTRQPGIRSQLRSRARAVSGHQRGLADRDFLRSRVKRRFGWASRLELMCGERPRRSPARGHGFLDTERRITRCLEGWACSRAPGDSLCAATPLRGDSPPAAFPCNDSRHAVRV